MADKKGLKKLTFEDLIAKKIEKDKNEIKFKDIEVPSSGGTLLFEKPLEEEIIACMDALGDGRSTSNVLAAYEILIYNCCPMLKDVKLHESLDIKVPTDIVKAMLDIPDRLSIGNELVEFSGIDSLSAKIKK